MPQPLNKNEFPDADELLASAIAANLEMLPEERIEAHENARQLMLDLEQAGKEWRAAEPQNTP